MTAIVRFAWLTLLGCASVASAQYGSQIAIELSASEMARLGVEWERPVAVEELALASAPAVVRVPPAREAIVSSPVAGLVTRLLVAEGGNVANGQALIELESMDLLRMQREYLDAVNQRSLADTQLERDRELYSEGIVAERRVHESSIRSEAARMQVAETRQQLLLAGISEPEIASLEASREITSTVTLDAPLEGTVVALGAALGEQIHALDSAARVADLSGLWLEIHIPQEQADTVSPGMLIRVEARGNTLNAEIVHVGQIVDTETQTVLIRGVVDNAGRELRSGQVLPATVLAVAGGRDMLALPAAALVRFDGRAHVFARLPNGIGLVGVEVIGEGAGRVYLASTLGLGSATEVAVRGVSALKSLLMNGSGEEG